MEWNAYSPGTKETHSMYIVYQHLPLDRSFGRRDPTVKMIDEASVPCVVVQPAS
jgi:hypothetical protein